ncbi:MAG: RHS repeat-associated core domain-containing protein, partial [Lachnospiraceae bacterium]|nr:RHS repeat-associated core domain-containing protein [Lachnospiraceae bacterium]
MNQLVATAIHDNLAHTTKVISYAYDDAGNRTLEKKVSITDASAILKDYIDASGKVNITADTEVKDTDVDTVDETEYNYNGLDQLIKSTKTTKNPKVGASQTEVVTTYTYDKKGNEIKESVGGKDKTMSVYDVMNNLVSTTVTEETKTVITSNEYDGSGQRIKKTVEETKGTKKESKETNYYYGNGGVLYTTDAKGDASTENIQGVEGQTFATVRSALVNGTNQTSEGQTGGNKGYIYSKDIRGSVTAVVGELEAADSTATTSQTVPGVTTNAEVAYDYTDYGETTQLVEDATFENEICYTGGIYDESTGLYYLNARHYSPETARFVSQDTYRGEDEKPDTWNLYMYCAGNPVVYTDPSGHKAEWWNTKKGKMLFCRCDNNELRVCTDGRKSKNMKKKNCNYYGDKNHVGSVSLGAKIAADEIPYLVIPEKNSKYSPYFASLGVIVDNYSGNYLYCVVAERGPADKGMGEASIYAVWKMQGIKAPKKGKIKKAHKIAGNNDYSPKKNQWKIILFEKTAPNSKNKKTYGWKSSSKALRKQIKKIGKNCYKGTGKCLN